MVAGQWEVWLTPCAKSITVPVTAAASLDELKEAVLNACMVATPELVPVSWLDASRIRQAMVLSARADAGDLTAIRFDDLRTLTPALQADVVPAEEAAALALLQAEEQRRQALVEAAALEALTFARANPLPPPLRSVPFLLRRTVPMYSIGIAWGAQYARARPLLPELGLPPWALWVAWLAGPVSGLVVQPLVGQLSDRTRGSSRCFAGKRRQWMWVGSLGLSASMLLMSSCSDLGLALGDAGNGTHPAARVLALLAFCSAGAFLSVLQGPARTLVVDAAPPEQQALANALFAVWDSLGKLSGFACGALLPDILPSASQHASGSSAFGSSAQQRLHLAADHPAPGGRALFADGRALFGLGVLALLVTQTVNQIGYVEPPPHPDAHAERLGHPFRPLLSSLRLVPTMPRRVRGVLACLLFLFLAWFATWLHLPAFMAVELFGGSSDAALADDDPAKLAYNEGTRAYRLGMAGAAAITFACAPTLPAASRRWGEGRVLLALELLHAALLLTAAFATQRALALAAIVGLGLPFAGFLVIPYTIVGQAAAKTSGAGHYMATMHLFLRLPELLVGPLVAATGGSTRTPLLVAAGSCLVAVGLVYHFLVASPGEQGAAMGARARPAGDEANLLAEDAARGALELPVRSKLAAAVGDDLSPDVWRAKADEPPAWVSPAGGHA